jgi:thioredoxin
MTSQRMFVDCQPAIGPHTQHYGYELETPMGLPVLDDAGFKQQVLEVPGAVLVDFMATWCGPCKSVGETLEKLAASYEGKVHFVKVDIDKAPQAATQFAITAVPQVFLFSAGKVVDQSMGAQPERKYRLMLDKHLG